MTEYTDKIAAAGYDLNLEAILDRYKRVLPKSSNNQTFKIIIEARQLDIDLSGVLHKNKMEYFTSMAEFKELEEELEQRDLFEDILRWEQQTIPKFKEHMKPTIEHVARYAIEYHDEAPMIPHEKFGEGLGMNRHAVGFRLDKLGEDKSLIKLVPKNLRSDGRRHANHYKLNIPKKAKETNLISKSEEKTITAIDTEDDGYDW